MELKDLKYLLAYIIPLSGYIAVWQGGVLSYLTLFIAFVLIPIAEILLGEDKSNLDPDKYQQKDDAPYFDWLLLINIPLLYGLLWFLFSTLENTTFETIEIIGMVLSVGTVGGSAGINVAHELGHKKEKLHKIASKTLLLPTLYMHFFIEHNRGHHVNVCTPEDPATSRYKELIYTFWCRTVMISYIHAWQLENSRLKKLNRPIFNVDNEMIIFSLTQVGYLIAIYFLFGHVALIAAVFVGIVSFLMLETLNYVQHYGLMRNLLSSGRYERVSPNHSWNSDHTLGRIILYELTRHSDHHYKASKRYQVLKSHDSSPQLPFGYPTSMVIALIPPLWFYLMNPRVKALKSSEVNNS